MDVKDSVSSSKSVKETREKNILGNISKWHSSIDPLASLSDEQADVIYNLREFINDHVYPNVNKFTSNRSNDPAESAINLDVINTNQDYVRWTTKAENEMQNEEFSHYITCLTRLNGQSLECKHLFDGVDSAVQDIDFLQSKYHEVVQNTNSLHTLSEQLMKNQRIVKEKKDSVNERLQYFKLFHTLNDAVEHFANKEVCDNVLATLDKIDECVNYLLCHQDFREGQVYLAKYENLLAKAAASILQEFNAIIIDTMKQVTDPSNQTDLISTNASNTVDLNEAAFSLYYGKFQSASIKIKPIIAHVETKAANHVNSCYENLLFDCHKTYFTQRSPVMSAAVTKTLDDLKQAHKKDFSVLFRSSSTFLMQLCLDEYSCFTNFFTQSSQHLHDYFAIVCQTLYDTLRPCLIGINHLEILTELCGILKKELLTDVVLNNEVLHKFVQVIRQLLEDVEERLVFRASVYFQHDLLEYDPSPGDLAYPEKLEQMESIATELSEKRSDSATSLVSLESQEVANINATTLAQFRSYTGNSPADLHGMWYPTVKRTLVCLSRLYFCLDREIFQGLAQEALAICVKTLDYAMERISKRKSIIDGRLFQIKHLLILREQISPFQVDFTIKEVSLDFSGVKAAAFGLLNSGDRLFSFSSNNALLEFLLEGTPKVREYLVDSRKDIDKHLKASCETLISRASRNLVGNILDWIQKVEKFSKAIELKPDTTFNLRDQDYGKPALLAELVATAKKNIKTTIPLIQRSMQLYLANRETEFILFKPVKNNVVNCFMQMESIIDTWNYSEEEKLMIACPNSDQISVFISSVSLSFEQSNPK